MFTLHKKMTAQKKDSAFLALRILSGAAFLFFLAVLGITSRYLYNNVYAGSNDAKAILQEKSHSAPHVIHFDRLDKIQAAWDRKHNTALDPSLRNPFYPKGTTVSAPSTSTPDRR
ncbi:MAG TPA: hypothetical protein VEA18_01965 [Candidatus Kapabacteria bacterium]|nr:hypothetical protein [Candidatus Kapabacteria bacterium]